MDCPYCYSVELKVTDKRNSPEGIRRRRECLKCNRRFTTYEKIDDNGFFVVKKDGRKEKFDRKKLEKGIIRAFEKRPVQEQEIDTLVNDVESLLRRKGKREIKALVIGEVVMRKIKKLDNVAYIRFASVCRDFQDLKDFNKEIEVLAQ